MGAGASSGPIIIVHPSLREEEEEFEPCCFPLMQQNSSSSRRPPLALSTSLTDDRASPEQASVTFASDNANTIWRPSYQGRPFSQEQDFYGSLPPVPPSPLPPLYLQGMVDTNDRQHQKQRKSRLFYIFETDATVVGDDDDLSMTTRPSLPFRQCSRSGCHCCGSNSSVSSSRQPGQQILGTAGPPKLAVASSQTSSKFTPQQIDARQQTGPSLPEHRRKPSIEELLLGLWIPLQKQESEASDVTSHTIQSAKSSKHINGNCSPFSGSTSYNKSHRRCGASLGGSFTDSYNNSDLPPLSWGFPQDPNTPTTTTSTTWSINVSTPRLSSRKSPLASSSSSTPSQNELRMAPSPIRARLYSNSRKRGPPTPAGTSSDDSALVACAQNSKDAFSPANQSNLNCKLFDGGEAQVHQVHELSSPYLSR